MESGLSFYQAKKYWFINGLRHELRFFYACCDLVGFKKRLKVIDWEFYESCRYDYADAFFEAEFTLIKLYHLDGNYKKAIHHIDSILATRVLYLIIHYDLDNEFYLPYAVQSLYRSLLKSSADYKAEARLISFLKKLPKIVDQRELIAAKRDLLKDWTAMKLDRFQRDFFYYFPYTEWISSKIEKKVFRDIYCLTAHSR
jgi:hypothetical protein